jgi:hypothetical protein
MAMKPMGIHRWDSSEGFSDNVPWAVSMTILSVSSAAGTPDEWLQYQPTRIINSGMRFNDCITVPLLRRSADKPIGTAKVYQTIGGS